MTATAGKTYVYDGDGERVVKCTGTYPTCSGGTLYWGGASTDALAESSVTGTMSAEYFFYLGKRMARRDLPSGTVHYYLGDHLGSARAVTDATGALTEQSDYSPYGGEIWTSGSDPNHYKFTGKERDSESGLDNFEKRYDASSLGRFMTTDPVVVTTERLKNPQQLNLYSYVANNPLRFIDPTGAILRATGDQQADYNDLCAIAGDACADRLKIDAKTGNVTFDTTGLDLSKNEGAALVNNMVTSKSTYEFSEGPTVMTDKGPIKIDQISLNLPTFGDQRQIGKPQAGVADIVGFNWNDKKVTQISNTKLGVAVPYTYVFHELAEAFEKIDGGKGGSYAAGHNAALQRERTLREQRPYLKGYNTGAGGPADSPNPEGGIIIKQ